MTVLVCVSFSKYSQYCLQLHVILLKSEVCEYLSEFNWLLNRADWITCACCIDHFFLVYDYKCLQHSVSSIYELINLLPWLQNIMQYWLPSILHSKYITFNVYSILCMHWRIAANDATTLCKTKIPDTSITNQQKYAGSMKTKKRNIAKINFNNIKHERWVCRDNYVIPSEHSGGYFGPSVSRTISTQWWSVLFWFL